MVEEKSAGTKMSDDQLQELVAATDTGGRNPSGPIKKLLAGVALFWSLFQLWIASPIPFALGFGVFNDTEARSIHLALALFLAYLAYPALKSSPRDRIPALTWIVALVAMIRGAVLVEMDHLSPGVHSLNNEAVRLACGRLTDDSLDE